MISIFVKKQASNVLWYAIIVAFISLSPLLAGQVRAAVDVTIISHYALYLSTSTTFTDVPLILRGASSLRKRNRTACELCSRSCLAAKVKRKSAN